MKILQDSTKKSSSPIQIPCTINIQYKSKISFFYLDKIILVSRLMITALDSATKSLANLNKNTMMSLGYYPTSPLRPQVA